MQIIRVLLGIALVGLGILITNRQIKVYKGGCKDIIDAEAEYLRLEFAV